MAAFYLTTERIPEYAINYLFNGDHEGLDEVDEAVIYEFECDMVDYAHTQFPNCNVERLIYDLYDGDCASSYFSHNPAFGLSCYVYDVDIYADISNH